MNPNYFDHEKVALEYLSESGIAIAKDQAAELSKSISYLTLVQASFLEVVAKGKKRVFIESSLINGKSTALILNILNYKAESQINEVCPLVTIVLPNKAFIDKFVEDLIPFIGLLEKRNVEISFVTNSEHATSAIIAPEKPVVRVVIGVIKDVIGLFRQNERAIEQLNAVMIDDLDLLVSLGQTNNVKRFIEYIAAKRQGFFNTNQFILTVKEDILEEITEIKESVKEKFVNIRITRNFEEEIAELDQEEVGGVEDDNQVPTSITQYFHLNTEKQLYSMLYLLLKFEIYPENYIILAENINDAYKLKLFLERANLSNQAKVYNTTHPVTLKAYYISLFNSKQNDVLISTKDFVEDMEKHKAKMPKLKRVRNMLFFNCEINYDSYCRFVDLLQRQPAFLKSMNDFNIIHLVGNDKKAKEDKDDDEAETQGVLASFNDLVNNLSESKVQLEPLPINKSDVQLFEYRVNEVLQSLSRNQVKLFQLIEVKKLMLKSKRMKAYFVDHQNERDLLLAKLNKMMKQFKKNEVKLPVEVPSYLTPSFLQAERKSKANKLDYILKRSKKESPMLRDAKTLSVLGSHKQWKIRHKIKKVANTRRIKKGLYDI